MPIYSSQIVYNYSHSEISKSLKTANMKFAIFTSLVAAFLGAHMVSATCCSECGGVLTQCIDECLAEGESELLCDKRCYGQGVSFIIRSPLPICRTSETDHVTYFNSSVVLTAATNAERRAER